MVREQTIAVQLMAQIIEQGNYTVHIPNIVTVEGMATALIAVKGPEVQIEIKTPLRLEVPTVKSSGPSKIIF